MGLDRKKENKQRALNHQRICLEPGIQFVLVAQSCRLFAIPWTATRQAPLSMTFSRQEYWSGLPCPSPRDLPDPGIQLTHIACLSCIGTCESESRSVMSESATPWTIQSMEFSRQEYWSGLPFLSPGDLPDPGQNLLHWQVFFFFFFFLTTESPRKSI